LRNFFFFLPMPSLFYRTRCTRTTSKDFLAEKTGIPPPEPSACGMPVFRKNVPASDMFFGRKTTSRSGFVPGRRQAVRICRPVRPHGLPGAAEPGLHAICPKSGKKIWCILAPYFLPVISRTLRGFAARSGAVPAGRFRCARRPARARSARRSPSA